MKSMVSKKRPNTHNDGINVLVHLDKKSQHLMSSFSDFASIPMEDFFSSEII